MSDATRPEEYQSPEESVRPAYEHPLPPILAPDGTRRGQACEQLHQPSIQSPHLSSTTSVFVSTHSPIQSQLSNRTLPSPPSNQHPRGGHLALPHFSSTSTHSAHAAHLQDLQHQISTKTLALQTLQREHDQLLAAFSRAQIRCNTLDKKSQVSDHEINSLTEEKIKLQHQVEFLEAQVEGLIKTREEVSKQSSADGAQWRQIMAMSSQLQMKSADEARRFKLERDAWEQDRASLEARIQQFERGQAAPAELEPASQGKSFATDNILSSTSVDLLRQEILRLRRKSAGLELMMQEMTGETDQIDTVISVMANLRQRLVNKKRRTESG